MITNTNEGLLYQKSNIVRQIRNCRNIAVPNIEQIPSLSSKFQELRQVQNDSEIDRLDQEIAKELETELENRKKLKIDLEEVEERTRSAEKQLDETNDKLVELPDFVSEIEEILRKGYEKFTGIKVLSKDEMNLMKDLPPSLSNIFNKFYNFSKGNYSRVKINIDGKSQREIFEKIEEE